MRKNLRNKRRVCKMCKPHKMGWANRWKPKELSKRKEMEEAIRYEKNSEKNIRIL